MNSRKVKSKEDKQKATNLIFAEVVFLDYMKQYRAEKELAQPVYFKEELGINDVRGFIKKLIKKNYLLKRGEEIRLTSKGERLLERYDDYLKFFQLAIPYITINDYQECKERVKFESNFEEVMIKLLLEKIQDLERNDNFYGVKNLHYDVGKLYAALDYKGQAMYHYLVSVYFSVNGLEYYDKFLKFIEKKGTKEDLQKAYEAVYIDPYIIASILEIKDVYYGEMTDAVYEKNKISINMCPKEKFHELIVEIIEGKFNNDKWQGWFKSAFNGLVNAVEKKR